MDDEDFIQSAGSPAHEELFCIAFCIVMLTSVLDTAGEAADG